VNKLILLLVMMLAIASEGYAQLGSADKDLVYTPVTPCRVLDTRTSQGGTGAIAANSSKHFKIWGQTSFAVQGGSPSNCGSNVAAVAMNFTVVTPASGGFITAYPFGGALPVAATVNFQVGDIARGDFTIAKVTQTGSAATNHVSVYSTSLADVVGDVVGYFAKPVSVGSFECETQRGAVLVLANSSSTADRLCNNPTSPPLPLPPLVMTGGGCDFDAYGPSLILSKSTPNLDNTGWFCRWQNATTLDITAFVYARCCRIPGR
jgi:hypothetical protein